MTELHLPSYPRDIAELPPGEVTLSVPLCNESIQIGDFSGLPKEQIIIETDDDYATTVRRTDGSPIQADIFNAITNERCPVFVEPVDCLQYMPIHLADGQVRWLAIADGLRVVEPGRLELLTITLGSYARRKSLQ